LAIANTPASCHLPPAACNLLFSLPFLTWHGGCTYGFVANSPGPAAMSTESPQLAFTQWLSRWLDSLCEALRRDDAHEAFFSRATDLADLERRQRAVFAGRPTNLFW